MLIPIVLLLVLAAAAGMLQVRAYPNYANNFPNGKNVRYQGESWNAVGHTKAFGAGPLNSFGEDFMLAGNAWTEELCRKDSDGDGRTNGEELQDPECKWKLGDANPGFKLLVTHPGIPDEECEDDAPAPSPSSSSGSSSSQKTRIAVIGSGSLGSAIRRALLATGAADVKFGVRDAAGDDSLSVRAAIEFASIVFIAVPAGAVADVVAAAGGPAAFANKAAIIDCTNSFTWDKGPVWTKPASGEGSVTQQLASALGMHNKRVVKAFNTFGAELFRAKSPAQVYMAGDDAKAKLQVRELAKQVGFVLPVVDVGPARNAALLEQLGVTWIHLSTVGGQGRDFALNLVKTSA